jgi:4-hydroxy-3-methylbut-2-enyl diphosphate reductase IspH
MIEEIQRHYAAASLNSSLLPQNSGERCFTINCSLLTIHYSICRKVANRLEKIQAFAARHDRIYFVAGEKSSNGRMLFDECRKANANTLLISTLTDLNTLPPPDDVNSIGICGATSTPKWLMERLRGQLILSSQAK